MIATVGLAIGFGKSDNLAAAYGVAVSATMLLTSILLFIAMREIWHWGLLASGAVAGGFILVDGSFLAANLTKILDGGYVPLVFAAAVYAVMLVWHRGAAAVRLRVQEAAMPIAQFVEAIDSGRIARVSGTAVFLTRTLRDVPPALVWQMERNRSLHEQLFVLTVISEATPWVADAERLGIEEVVPGFCRATARFGFMERLNVPALLCAARMRAVRWIFAT